MGRNHVPQVSYKQAMKLVLLLALSFGICAGSAKAQVTMLDPTFGDGGVAMAPPVADNAGIFDVALAPDGSLIVAGGKIVDGHTCGLLQQFTSNGQLDLAFGTNGSTVLPEPGGYCLVFRVITQPDGKILGAGRGFGYEFVVRLLPDGNIDEGFADHGFARIANINAYVGIALHLQPDGKILFGFYDQGLMKVFRFTDTGMLDSGFGVAGVVVCSQSGGGGTVTSFGLQADGRILVGGSNSNLMGTQYFRCLARLEMDGSLDPTFGIGGMIATDSLHAQTICAIQVAQNGRIWVSGNYTSSSFPNFVLAGLLPNGWLDPSIPNNGALFNGWDASVHHFLPSAMKLQSDGSMILGGTVNPTGGSSIDQHFACTHFLANGSLDTGFGVNGLLIADAVFTSDRSGMVVQQDGGVVVGGYHCPGGICRATLVRFINGLPLVQEETSSNNTHESGIRAFPIPATDSFTADIQLVRGGRTTIGLFDVVGRNVCTLMESNLNAGDHHLQFMIPADLTDGSYVLTVTGTGDASSTMLVVQR